MSVTCVGWCPFPGDCREAGGCIQGEHERQEWERRQAERETAEEDLAKEDDGPF